MIEVEFFFTLFVNALNKYFLVLEKAAPFHLHPYTPCLIYIASLKSATRW